MKSQILLFSLLYTTVNAHSWQLFDHRKVIETILQPSSVPLNDGLCQTQLTQFAQALASNEDWAVRLVDTWAKIQAGYLSGNSFNLGDFDSCISFRHDSVQGQHCWVAFTALPHSTLDVDRDDISLGDFANFLRNTGIVPINGFCLPASCSIDSIVQFLNQQFLFRNDLVAVGGQCRAVDPPPFEPITYFAIVLFGIVVLLLITSTSYEIAMKHRAREANKLLISFSVYNNSAKLYDVTKVKGASSLNCLHGLRAMSIFWIILGHRVYNQFPWGNPSDFQAFYQQGVLSPIVKAHTIAVDTFLLMGALLMTMSTLLECEKANLNIARMIWKRYLRYTPVYGMTILATVAFSQYLLRGPYDFAHLVREPCIANWWMALLYVQNYLPSAEMCLNHGWYLSVDFQLFLISPFIVYAIHKLGKKLLALPIALCLAIVAYLISISFVFDIRMPTATVLSADYLQWVYYPTQSRAGPWFIGMELGYFLHTHRGKIIRINGWINALMWILSLSVLSSIVLLTHALSIAAEPSTAASAFFIALHRNLWAISLCWVIFACQHLKTGGIVRWFLSVPQWQPISRMGLSMYIIGAVYQAIMTLNQRTPLFMTAWHMFPVLWSDMAIVIVISTFSYLAFEVPPMLVEDYVYKKFKNRKEKNPAVPVA